jgi:hypothetical protein
MAYGHIAARRGRVRQLKACQERTRLVYQTAAHRGSLGILLVQERQISIVRDDVITVHVSIVCQGAGAPALAWQQPHCI